MLLLDSAHRESISERDTVKISTRMIRSFLSQLSFLLAKIGHTVRVNQISMPFLKVWICET